jgi:hypothetical protein
MLIETTCASWDPTCNGGGLDPLGLDATCRREPLLPECSGEDDPSRAGTGPGAPPHIPLIDRGGTTSPRGGTAPGGTYPGGGAVPGGPGSTGIPLTGIPPIGLLMLGALLLLVLR